MLPVISIPTEVKSLARFLVASLFAWLLVGGGAAALISLYLKRRAQPAENKKTNAEAELVLAQAEETRIRTKRTSAEYIDDLGDMFARAAVQVVEFEERRRQDRATIEHQRLEIEALTLQVEGFLAERKLAQLSSKK